MGVTRSRRRERDLFSGAGSRIPSRRVRQFLEIRCRDVRTAEVSGVVDLCRYGEPLIAIGHGVKIVVLRYDRVLAVRRTVSSDISCT